MDNSERLFRRALSGILAPLSLRGDTGSILQHNVAEACHNLKTRTRVVATIAPTAAVEITDHLKVIKEVPSMKVPMFVRGIGWMMP